MQVLPLVLLFALRQTTAQIPQEREQYRFDMNRLFYDSESHRAADKAKLQKAIEGLKVLEGKVGESAENLLRTLQGWDEVSAIERKLSIESHVRWMIDTRNTVALQEESALDASLIPTGFVQVELAKLPLDTFDNYAKAEPKLRPYRFEVESAHRNDGHQPPPEQQGVFNEMSQLTTQWPGELFEELRRDNLVKSDPELKAFGLIRLATALNKLAKISKFDSDVQQYLYGVFMDRSYAYRVLESLATGRDLTLEYGKIRRDYVAARGDQKPPAAPSFTVAQGVAHVKAALAPLGEEYNRELAALLDPKNGRIDIAGGPSRNGLGTGWGFPQTQISFLYWPEYTGIYDDLDRGLSHEGGHAIHYQLMRNHHTLPCYSDGPGYFFESFAEFNQLLLADHLYRTAKDKESKFFFLSQFIEKAKYPIWLAFYPALEFAIHDGVAAGKVRSKEDLDALELSMAKKYWSPDATLNPLRPVWSTNEAFYTHPLYNINHLMGAVLALAYYNAYTKDPKGFVPKYLDLMRNGFDATPADLLKKFLGMDLNDPQLVTGCFPLVKAKIEELRKLS